MTTHRSTTRRTTRRPASLLASLAASALLVAALGTALASALVGPYASAAPGDSAQRAPLCQGERATIRGTAGPDTITGTRGRDVIITGNGADTVSAGGGNDLVCTGDGNDVVSGGGGNDKIRTETGRDHCSGGAGSDSCDGGPKGRPGTRPSDPDVCAEDVEHPTNCRRDLQVETWVGEAHGSIAEAGSVTESWTATYEMGVFVDGTIWQGPARYSWTIEGTAPDGCTVDGDDAFTGVASLTVYQSLDEWHFELRGPMATSTVTGTCPGTGAYTDEIVPLNTDFAFNFDHTELPDDWSDLSGDTEYLESVDGYPVEWEWQLFAH